MRIVVGVSDMAVSSNPDDEIVTYALGSCIGVMLYDPEAMVAGMLHFQLPSSKNNPEKAKANPFMYADTGIPELFKKAYSLGAEKKRIVVKVAGGGKSNEGRDMFDIGRRNYVIMRKIFWKNNVLISEERIGDNKPVTVRMEVATGRVLLKIHKEIIEI